MDSRLNPTFPYPFLERFGKFRYDNKFNDQDRSSRTETYQVIINMGLPLGLEFCGIQLGGSFSLGDAVLR